MFFKNKGPFKLKIIKKNCNVQGISSNGVINSIKGLKEASKNDLTFLENSKYISDLKFTKAKYCILKEKYAEYLPANCKGIFSDKPLIEFIKIATLFYPDARFDHFSKSYLSENILKKKYKTVSFGKNVQIAKNVKIGRKSQIGSNVIIEDSCVIGSNVTINSNSIIRNSIIGDNAIINFGCVLGKVGFGYKFIDKKIAIIPHIGSVFIGKNCNIGAYCVIDRGSFSNTKIKDNTSLDNFVHIAHNVEIGSNSFIAGQVGIAGSTLIGNNVMIGGQAGISGHLNIGNNVKIGGKSGVINNIGDNQSVMGYPAVSVKSFIKDAKK